MTRHSLINAKSVIIKVGSKVLLNADGEPNIEHITHLVEQIAYLHRNDRHVAFVTSGAIGAGMQRLGLKKRPTDLAMLQAAAAVGQVRLMRAYEDLFGRFNCSVAQILLTHDDLKDRKRHLNIKRTINTLWESGVIPIINENDTVSVDEIKFGDNDVLASMLAMLLEVKALILLTTSPGFMVVNEKGEKERLPQILKLTPEILCHIEKHKAGLSLGGMESKIMAAANMNHVGGVAIIAPGMEPDILYQIFSGENVGTLVGNPSAQKKYMPGRKRWIAFYNHALGAIKVDDGAKSAILNNGKSLLAIGVRAVDGSFLPGAVVDLVDLSGQTFAKGISEYNSLDLARIMGQESQKVKTILGHNSLSEVIHRDNLVVLKEV
jgi:glutamate 5-kinase